MPRGKELLVPFSSVAPSASVELTLQTSKCEPVLMEDQAEMQGRTTPVSTSVTGVNQAELYN